MYKSEQVNHNTVILQKNLLIKETNYNNESYLNLIRNIYASGNG